MDADDVVEIPPPVHLLKRQRKRGTILHDAIIVDDGGDSEDLVMIGEVNKNKRGKTDEAIHQVVLNPDGKSKLSSPKLKSVFQSRGGKMKAGSNLEAVNLLSPATIKFMKESSTIDLHRAVLRKLKSFKKFGYGRDASDHHFISEYSSTSKEWAELIKKERENLKKNLPDSIFVRVYKSRLDLLRAVIVGAEGTPYHNGLFFFDIYFPNDYPNIVPLVYCHVKNYTKFNPLFERKSRLPLSRIKTWPNSNQECWVPGVSNILDVLVSIQGLVFNGKPFFNQFHGQPSRNIMPNIESVLQEYIDNVFTHARNSTVPHVETLSQVYNDNVFTHSMLMMRSLMKRPPKYFENFVVGHFVSRAHDILVACNAFLKDRPHVLDEESPGFNLFPKGLCVDLVRKCTNALALELSRIGAPDCEKFLSEEIINAGQFIYRYYENLNFVID